MDPAASQKFTWIWTGSSKVDKVLEAAKSEWSAADIKALLLEACQKPRSGEVADIEKSVCGNLKWQKMEASDEYEPAGRSEAEVYGLEFRGYLLRWNATRRTLYGYKGQSNHRAIFSEPTVKVLGTCRNFTQLLAAIQELALEYQNTAGWRGK
ncbi:hypothetical protein V490_09465 [Pseudogymnoascus sp. VKM F-3557]|nr:hypothetical protein V490_09465 [Pseudogymnoascus sp. VKM F-3557]